MNSYPSEGGGDTLNNTFALIGRGKTDMLYDVI